MHIRAGSFHLPAAVRIGLATSAVAGLLLLPAPAVSFFSERAILPALRWPIALIAHRAGAGIAPENSLAAIRQAIRLQIDYVELDVRTTRDGALVIMHDSKVDRTTDGQGAVRDLTLAEVRQLKLKNRFGGEFDGQRVPTFDEVLALCQGKVGIYVDHKEAPTAAVLAAIRAHGMEKNVVVYNNPIALKEWKRLFPAIPIMPSLPGGFRRQGGIAEFEADCPAEVLDGHMREWTRELVDQAHAVGVQVYVDGMGPTDNPQGYAEALRMGVDGIQTDYPDRLSRFLRARPEGEKYPLPRVPAPQR